MPKKIFNSDLETSRQVIASTLTDGTATISGGVITASNVSVATVTSSTLTDGTATLSGGVFTASTLTDGTATISGGVISASTITDGTTTLSGGVLTGLDRIIPDSTTNELSIRNNGAGTGNPIGVTVSKGVQGSAYLKLIEEGNDGDRGARIVYAGDTQANEDVGVDTTNIGGNLADVIAIQSLEAGNVHNVISFNKLGGDVSVNSADTITLTAGTITFDGLTLGSGANFTSFSTSSPGVKFIVDDDNNSDSDYFRVESGQEILLNLTYNVNDSHYIALPTAPNFNQPKELSLTADFNNPEDSNTTISSRGRIDFIFGAGYTTQASHDNDGRTVTWRTPTWAADGIISGSTSVMFLNSNGDLTVTNKVAADIVEADTVTADTVNADIVTASTITASNLTTANGGLLIDAPIELSAGGGNSTKSMFKIKNLPAEEYVGRNNFIEDYWLVISPEVADPNDDYTGSVFYSTDNTFFSGGHVYSAPESIPVGSVVNLVNGSASVSTTSLSKIAVGIVARQKECTQESTVKTSFGETLTSGYAVKVVSVGDTRHKDCQGFNVCNENGDIQAGDLLVTSNTPGYLMKQNDDIIRSSTVGKAMEAVTFDDNGQATGVYGFIYCG